MAIDITTNVGKLRLRCGDVSDLPFLNDLVYLQAYTDSQDNLPRAAKLCAQYILAQLAFRTHKKLASLEIWGGDAFVHYKEFLMLTINNPAFMDISPIPVSSSADLSPMLQFQNDWNRSFTGGTQSQQLAVDAALSPNDGSLYGSSVGTGY